jgi:hypothetical protein
MRTVTLRVAVAVLQVMAVSALVSAKGLPDNYEGPLKIQKWGEITEKKIPAGAQPAWRNDPGDRMYQLYWLHAERDDQQAHLWVPGGVKSIRGVVVDLGWPYEAWKTHLQEFARSQDFAVLSGMWRYARLPDVVAVVLERFGKEIGHPELANAPWLTRGFSRMGYQSARCAAEKPERVISCYIGGSPGATLPIFGRRGRSKEQTQRNLEIFRRTPVIFINGSEDPFVGRNKRTNTPYFAWANRVYPRLRAKDVAASLAVEWGAGHGSHNNAPMLFAFWKAAIDARYPKDADPRKGTPPLKPLDRKEGYVVEVGYWGVTDEGKGRLSHHGWAHQGDHLGEPIPCKEYDGKGKRTVWLPDEYTAAVWRAFVGRPDPGNMELEVRYLPGEPSKKIVLEARGRLRKKSEWIKFYNGDRLLGECDPANSEIVTDKLSSPDGVHAVYAAFGLGDTVFYTQPVAICGGRIIDQPAGQRFAKRQSRPGKVLHLGKTRSTLAAIRARKDANAPAEWKVAFEDDFSDGELGDAWYEYYSEGGNRRVKKDRKLEMKIVDGHLQVGGNLQTVAMLRYDWPDDVAVEYRARSMADRHCDLSVVLSGNRGGTAFPWRQGMMFQFGAHFNKGSHFLIKEQPKAKCDVKIKPKTWQTVRVERLDGLCTAWVDGKKVSRWQLSEAMLNDFFGRRIGFYTFGSTGQFDDVKVYVRAFRNPESVEPPLPSVKERVALAKKLIELQSSPYSEQRYLAWRTLRNHSFVLTPAFRHLLENDLIENDRTRKTIRRIVEAARPPAEE